MPKISELNPLTSLSNDDLVPVVNDPNGSPSNNKITFDNFANSVYQNFDSKGVFDLLINAANTGNVSFSNTTISTRHNNQNLILTSQNGNVSIIPDANFKWNFSDGFLELNSTETGYIMSIGEGMGPTIYANGSIIVYGYDSNIETDENWNHGSIAYPGTYQITSFYSNNAQYSYKESSFTLRGDDTEVSAKIHLDDGQTQFDWLFDSNGILNLPSTVGDIYRDGISVISSATLSPNIAYTGVFNGYPATIPVTKGQGIHFTSNNYVLETTNKYWMSSRFDTSDYDLSGVETLDFNNIGGVVGRFRIGGKSENILTDINLHDITVIRDYFYIRDLPALETFSANNLSYVENYLQIDTMDNANTQFNFPNLKTITGSLYYTYNNTLENTPQFPVLETVGNIYIYYNSATQNTMTFDSLSYFGYAGIYQNNGMLSGPEFPALTSFDYMDMNNNDVMIDPPTFPVLETVTSSWYFSAHDSVTTAPSTPALVSCNYIGWYNNPSMANGFNFSSLKQVNGDVDLNGCALDETSVNYILTTLAGLDGTDGTTSYDNRTINVGGGTNAVPTGDGLTAITTLSSRGCVIYANNP